MISRLELEGRVSIHSNFSVDHAYFSTSVVTDTVRTVCFPRICSMICVFVGSAAWHVLSKVTLDFKDA